MAATGVVLILAAGADWEPAVLAAIDARRDLAVLRRCMDVEELLAAAAAGQADSAVVGTDARGLDARVVEQLQHHGVRTVGVLPAGAAEEHARARAVRAGIGRLVGQAALGTLPDLLLADEGAPAVPAQGALGAGASLAPGPSEVPGTAGLTGTSGASGIPGTSDTADADGAASGQRAVSGRVWTVWGGAGAPGRSTVAAAVAAELARRERSTLLVDADPYGGSVAQQLGILDQVSGLLAAARLVAGGGLETGLSGVVRMLGSHLGVITGLPRPDRWAEVRGEMLADVITGAARMGEVIIDAGFCLEDDDLDARAGRNQLTLTALDLADEVLVVGTADPVGLTRLVRGLADLRGREAATQVRVVINRVRPTLGWTEREIAGTVRGVVGQQTPIHFLPDDRATVDKALVAGRTLLEAAPDGPLPRAVAALVDAVSAAQAAKSG